jgi:hypothetical protein
VQCVEQRRVDEGARPNHARRPHEESTEQAGNGISHELGREADHDLVAEPEALPVEEFLGQQEIGGVGAKFNDLGHDGDDGVLLDVEWTGVQGPDVAEGVELGGGENPCEESTDREAKQLHDDTGHENGGVWRRSAIWMALKLAGHLQRKLNSWLNAGRAAEKKRPIAHLEEGVSEWRNQIFFEECLHPDSVNRHRRIVDIGNGSTDFGIWRFSEFGDQQSSAMRVGRETYSTSSSSNFSLEAECSFE